MLWISKMFQAAPPPYKLLSLDYMPNQFSGQYFSKIHYTPKTQMIPYTQQFNKYVHFLRRKKYVEKDDLRQFTKNMLIQFHTVMKEDRPELNIMLEQKVMVPKGELCKYHGEVDFMYSIDGYNPTPVLHFESLHINPTAAVAAALSNLHIRLSMKQKNPFYLNKRQKQIFGFSIATTGHEWQLIKINEQLKLQKTLILQGTYNQHRNIYDDQKMMQVILGMLQFTLDHPRQNVQVLENAYRYIDERKYMLEAETPEEASKGSLVSKFIQKFKSK